MGISGAGHCVAMCGSLTMAVGFAIPKSKSFLLYNVVISSGRICGYVTVGLLVNLLGQSMVRLSGGLIFHLSLMSSLLMFGVALHILKINHWVLQTERLGKSIDRFLQPLKKRLLPVDSVGKAFSYGALWGFLPCGLVYTALTFALISPSSFEAGLVMLCFGLGTLPTLVLFGSFSHRLRDILNRYFVRLLMGILVLILAVFQAINTLEKLQTFTS